MATYDFTEKSTDYYKSPTDGKEYYPYTPPSDQLVKAVTLAIALQRPILVEGEPGSGKTQLAYSLARQLAEQNKVEEWPFKIWNIKSSSRAQDGLYTFDAIERLRDAQLAKLGDEIAKNELQDLSQQDAQPTTPGDETVKNELQGLAKYIRYGPLGEAIKEREQRAILLIDEVDKGSSDFANDLLDVLEQFSFYIPEAKISHPCPPAKPIVIITSNGYRPLPEAFLRRCLYFKILFPEGKLAEIIQERLKSDSEMSKAQADFPEAIECFLQVREAMTEPHRKPSTSELIDFIQALATLPKKERPKVLQELPDAYLGTLLKDPDDYNRFRQWQKEQKKT